MTGGRDQVHGDDELQVWFLTGSQALYGDDVLDQVAAQSRQVAEGLAAATGRVRVVWKPVLTTGDAIRRACLEATADDACVGVVAWMHTFSPARMWIAGLGALGKPLLHLHTQANRALPWATIDMDFMNLNQAAHGDRELGYVQTRMQTSRTVVVGHVEDPVVTRRVDAWSRAARGLHAARTLRLSRFGDNMRDVAVTDGDKVAAQVQLGVDVRAHGVNDLVAVVDAATDAEVDAVVAACEEAYEVADELRTGGDRHDALREAARIEVGLRTFLEEEGSAAFTTNFEDLGGLRQLPGLAVQRLMADGYGFGGEGDWKTSALLHILKVMSEDRPGGTSFMEDYTYHLGPGTPRVLGAHMLEVCPSIADATPTCEVHPLAIGDREDPVRLVFTAAPGPAVVVGLADLGGRFRLTANAVEVVAPDEPLPNLPVARAVWSPEPDLATSAEAWILSGAPHHTVLSSAVGSEALEDLADMLRTELVTIDATTTVPDLKRELRWNDAYHRLVQAGRPA